MDGFHQDETASESYKRGVVLGCLLAAQGDALEPLDFPMACSMRARPLCRVVGKKLG